MKPCPTLSELPPPPPSKTCPELGRRAGWPWTEESQQLPDTMPNGEPWPKISIITPSYNQRQFIEETIRSVLLQGYPNLEYIIIDGGSTDNSVESIKKYEPWLNYWVSESDDGIYYAMEKGIRVSKGDWIYFLGADDVLLNCLRYIALKLRNKSTIYYGNVFYKKQNIKYAGQFTFYKLLEKNICQQAIFYPRKVFEKYNYNIAYKALADYELNLRCWKDPELKFSYLDILIAVYNDEQTQPLDNVFYDNKKHIIKTLFPFQRMWLRVLKFNKQIIRQARSFVKGLIYSLP